MLCSRNMRDLESVVANVSKDRLAFKGNPLSSEYDYKVNEFVLEEKLDGERIQLHKKGETFSYFSRSVDFLLFLLSIGCPDGAFISPRRKANDYTYLYGSSYEKGKGSLTPFLNGLLQPGVEEFVQFPLPPVEI